ncbi:MAG: alpha/beta hydrolase, partial [Bdellovibrio sp.]
MFITIYSLILLVSLIHTRRSTKIPLFWFLSLFSSIFTVLAFWLSALVLIWKGSLTLTLAGFGTVLLAIELIALLGILIRDARNFSYAEQSWLRIWRLPSLADRNSEKFYFKNSRGEQLCGKIYPPRDASFPLIIQLHGGGYTYGSIEQMNAFNLALNEWGYGVAVLPYGKIPKAHLQDILDDLKSGYEFITRERQGQYNGNTILSGRSAGGHLSLALGHLVQDPHIKGYVLF